MNDKITILQLRMYAEEDDVYVFQGYHDLNALFPFIINWCNRSSLNYEDENQSWFKTITQSTLHKLL